MSTQESLLIMKYSRLLAEVTLENSILREELTKARSYNEINLKSRDKWKCMYEALADKVKHLANCRGALS
jgi:hypothetical protein